ncbi:MAG: UvrD-helicase domain-containing protein [Phycisphaerae bacterium]|nr:UvrD-helicase domain-containing protein [Phycisphaerae bacterium]
MSPERLLEGLTQPQREAVMHRDGPLLVLAGPGSGKTRVITHRAAYLACTATGPEHILTITFTNKAAGEMAERMAGLGLGRGVTCCTFHAFCARLLRIYHEQAGLGANFSIYDDGDQVGAMREALARLDLSSENFTPGAVLGAISRAKNEMCTPAEFRAQRQGWQDRKIADIFDTYQKVLTEQNAVDFDDLLVKAAMLLGEHPELRERLEDRYRYVLVDEYQDTNRAQYLIARGLCLERGNLCVTGDPDQSIYAWRGADIGNILAFEEDFPAARVVRLEENYRSTPQILGAAGALITHNRRRKVKALLTTKGDGRAVWVVECEDERAEAAYIASQIVQHAEQGGSYRDVAVFYRVNALTRSLEGALLDARVPYQIARGVAFYQRKEIKDVLAYLRLAANPQDLAAFKRIINVPARGLGKVTVERVLARVYETGRPVLQVLADPDSIPGTKKAGAALRSFAGLMCGIRRAAEGPSVKDAVEYVTRHSGLIATWDGDSGNDALENVNELINAAAEYDRQHVEGGSVTGWLEQVSLVSDVDAIEEGAGAVTLMTLHAAKGLEFDVVYVAGVEHGLLPHERGNKELADVEEERRLLFVGMTRARRELTLSCARWRAVKGRFERRTTSLFLTELPREGVERTTLSAEGTGADGGPREVVMPPEAVEYASWRKGQLVRHAEYGLGRVQWIQPRTGGLYAGVTFSDCGQKTLALKHAPLELVDTDELD